MWIRYSLDAGKNTLETTAVLSMLYLRKVRRRKCFDGWPVLCPKVIAVLVVVVVWVVVVLLGGLGGGAEEVEDGPQGL